MTCDENSETGDLHSVLKLVRSPTLTRSYPRRFTFYVARPTRSIHQ